MFQPFQSQCIDIQLFQPIWEKYHSNSILVQRLLNKNITNADMKSDIGIYYQFVVCYTSINFFKGFYTR